MENKRPFRERSNEPTKEKLEQSLHNSYSFYMLLDELSAGFRKEWNFSKSSGWMQKVHDGKKALYYFIPLHDAFLVSLTLREEEKTAFLSDDDLYDLHEQLKNAKKYSEGYALQFPVENEHSFLPLKKLMARLTMLRKQ